MSTSEPHLSIHPRILGEGEDAVMDVLWAATEPLSVKDVQTKLERGLAYTTVMTTLDRLFRKGLLEREKDGQAFLYFAAMPRAAFHRRMMDGLLGEMLPESGDTLLAAFVDLAAQADEGNLERLAQLIAERRKEKA